MASTRSRSSADTRSTLLITSTSANSICSTSRSTTVRSSSSPARRWRRARSSSLSQSRQEVLGVDHRHHGVELGDVGQRPPCSSSKVKVSATGSGSETPVDSISR
jgi:hypothetical protein